jgi:hypothetical protein
MNKQIVIDKETKKVLRFGHCDFENDGSFDSDTEQIIEQNFRFSPGLYNFETGETTDWFYDEENDTFTNMIYGEITADGDLIEISLIKPEHRNPREGSIVVELKKFPPTELHGKPVKYDRLKKEAYLDEDVHAEQLEIEKKQEILDLIRQKNEIGQAIEATGLDFTDELAEIEERMQELTESG